LEALKMHRKRRCTFCKEYFEVKHMIKAPNSSLFCSFGHMASNAHKNKDKGKQIMHKAQKKAFELSDLPKQHKLTQTVFNKLRVLQELREFERLGIEPHCVSCGKTKMDWCCGHLKSVGSSRELRYSPINTYLQCNKYCNMSLSGNINGTKTTHGYLKGLALRFGEDKAETIIEYLNSPHELYKFTGAELVDKRKEYNKLIKELL